MPNFQENFNQYSEPFPWTPEADSRSNQAPGQRDYASYQQSGQRNRLSYQPPVPPVSLYAAPTSQVEREKLRPKQTTVRMPKARTLSLVQTLKRLTMVVSIAAFGLFSALVASNLHNTAAATHASLSNHTTNQTPTTTDNSGGFFGNQGGGYGFGNGGSTQSPGTSSHVS